MNDIKKNLGSLVIFRHLISMPAIKALIKLEESKNGDVADIAYAYGEFMSELYLHTENFSRFMLDACLDDENIYTRKMAKDASMPSIFIILRAAKCCILPVI